MKYTAHIKAGERNGKLGTSGISVMLGRPVKNDVLLTIEEATDKNIRSAQQNKTFWMICGDIGKHEGTDRNEISARIKREYIYPIIAEHDEYEGAVLQKIFDALVAAPQEAQDRAVNGLISSIQPRNILANAMNHALEFYQSQGYRLRNPEDYKLKELAEYYGVK